MLVEQAVYTSAKTRYGEGYHVVSRSPGISNDIVTALNRWCPSHAALENDVLSESINFHPLVDDSLALSRTTYGVREFSGRGGLQVVTIVLVLRASQFGGFENNPYRLARVARALGHLRWTHNLPERVDAAELPDGDSAEAIALPDEEFPGVDETVPIVNALGSGKRVTIANARDREVVGEAILRSLPSHRRLSISFSTGLRISRQRPFDLQFANEVDDRTAYRLRSDNIELMDAPDLKPA